MKEAVVREAEALIAVLSEQHQLACGMLQSASDKEAALLADDLDALKAVLELEEDTVIEFRDCEKRRLAQTEALLKALAEPERELSLRDIAGKIPEHNLSARLLAAGNKLAEVVFVMREKNIVIQDILSLKSDYADAMLELLTGKSAAPRNYNDNGSLDEQAETGPGVVEVFA